MKINFKTRKLEKQLTDPKTILKKFGTMARKVTQRMDDLRAETLEVIKSIPMTKCHELKNDRKGQLAISISKNYRIIFEPNHNPLPENDDGGLDWTTITIIKIIEVTDYH